MRSHNGKWAIRAYNKNSSIMRPNFTVQAFKLRGIVEQSKSISRSRNNV